MNKQRIHRMKKRSEENIHIRKVVCQRAPEHCLLPDFFTEHGFAYAGAKNYVGKCIHVASPRPLSLFHRDKLRRGRNPRDGNKEYSKVRIFVYAMKNKNLLLFLVLAVAGFAIWYFWSTVIYIIIAGILALIGQPIDRFYMKYFRFRNYKLSATISAGLAFLTLFLAFFILAIFFIPLVLEEAALLSSLDRNTIIASFQKPMENIDRLMHSMNIEYESANLQSYFQEKLISFFTVTNITLLINQFISTLGDFFIAFFAISFLTFFFLRDEEAIIRTILSIVPKNYSEKAKTVWLDSESMLKRYFIGVLVEILLVITFLSIGLWICGIKHAILIALFAGLMNVIPYVGPLIGCAFALFIGLTTNSDMTMAGVIVKILIVFPIVNLADAFLLQPLIYSSSVKAHPVEIFLVILIGATIGGVGGMILAVPSYTILRVFVKEFFSKREVYEKMK